MKLSFVQHLCVTIMMCAVVRVPVTGQPVSPSAEPGSELTDPTSHEASQSTSEPDFTSGMVSSEGSEMTSEPESDVTSEPESEAPQAESEITPVPTSNGSAQAESEPGSTGISVTSSEATPQSESEEASEPESDVTPESVSEPEVGMTSDPESDLTSEPDSEIMSDPESNVSSEPESATLGQQHETAPTLESMSDLEPEPTLEPGSLTPGPELTLQPESETTEAESNRISTPESEVAPESESDLTSETDETSESESDLTSETDETSESESESEATSDAESDTSAITAGPETSDEASAEERPSPAEIVVPPMLLILGLVAALLVLLVRSRRASINKTLFGVSKTFLESLVTQTRIHCHPAEHNHIKICVACSFLRKCDPCIKVNPIHVENFKVREKHNEDIPVKLIHGENVKVIDLTADGSGPESEKAGLGRHADDRFFTDFDLEVLDSLRRCYNNPRELVRIAMPAVLSLALCPLTLYMFEPFSEFVWPGEDHANRPDINDAIACYLSPAGLVYATSFGFAFQQVLLKQHEILTKMTEEISMLDQIATFTVKLQVGLPTKLRILQAVKAECIFMVLQVLDRSAQSYKHKPAEDIRVKIWTVVDLLREVDIRQNNVDRVLSERILNHVMRLNSICSDRMGILHTRIHPVKWIFLETLGFCSFLGILLLTADSYRMELIMCIITVFSISMLCYVVSDLDFPFSGFFRVDIGVLEEVLRRLDLIYEMARHSGRVDVFYPD